MEQRNQERQGIKKALISAFNTLAAIGKQVEDKVGQVIRVLDQTANDPVLSLFAMNEIGLNIAVLTSIFIMCFDIVFLAPSSNADCAKAGNGVSVYDGY